MKILVTGAAGFIGMHVAMRLLSRGDDVVGVDNLNDYYDVKLKQHRLQRIEPSDKFRFVKLDISDKPAVDELFSTEKFQRVINLAAQSGVRYSLINPHAYISSNIAGFTNILEGCRSHGVEHLVYASSSSVYGSNTNMPFSVHQNVDHPVSLYAATKKASELMAHSYSHLYALPTTGLRFFTVYGPWGRPDMSPSLFADAIRKGEAINVFNEGRMRRDFTYIDDIVEGVVRTLDLVAKPDLSYSTACPDPGSSYAPYRLYNIGSSEPVELMTFITTLEKAMGREAILNMLPMQAGDVVATCADLDDLNTSVGFSPNTSLSEGIGRFVAWHNGYYG